MIPYYNKIIIEPEDNSGPIKTGQDSKKEKGRVISIGRDVTFVKVGDTVYFDSWGCSTTADGHYVISEDPNIIQGKDSTEHER